MPKIVRHQLRAKQVEKLAAPGVYQDGGGLQLRVRDTGAKFWVLRVTAKGKRRDKGLGSFPDVSLEEARAKADAVRREIKSGVSMSATRADLGITLKEAFDTCWKSKRETLTNAKHRQQWESTMATYVFSKIGHMSGGRHPCRRDRRRAATDLGHETRNRPPDSSEARVRVSGSYPSRMARAR